MIMGALVGYSHVMPAHAMFDWDCPAPQGSVFVSHSALVTHVFPLVALYKSINA